MSVPAIETTTEWSHIRFGRPVPLVRRDELKLGDLVQSSHGYKGVVADINVNPHPEGTVYLNLELHCNGSGVFQSEIYPRSTTIPLLHRPEPVVATVENYRRTEHLVELVDALQSAVARNDVQASIASLHHVTEALAQLVERVAEISA